MQQWLYDVLIQILCYVGLALFVVLVLDFMTARALRTWFRVKTSSGKLILVCSRNIVQDYFRAGRIEDGFIIFKGLNKEPKRVAVPPGAVYRAWGVNCILVDDIKNAVMLRDFNMVPGYDAEKHESLYLRALYRPTLMDDKTKIILILLVAVILVVGFGFYMTKGWIDGVNANILALKAIATPTIQNAGQVITTAAGG